jgi:hypothetical protein
MNQLCVLSGNRGAIAEYFCKCLEFSDLLEFSAANKQYRPVLAPENFPNLLPFFTEDSPHFFAGVFTLDA